LDGRVAVIAGGAGAIGAVAAIMTVSPGVVDTGFVPGRGPDFNARAAATIPLGRIGSAEDVAVAIEACITQLRFATGHRIVVDGGRHLR